MPAVAGQGQQAGTCTSGLKNISGGPQASTLVGRAGAPAHRPGPHPARFSKHAVPSRAVTSRRHGAPDTEPRLAGLAGTSAPPAARYTDSSVQEMILKN